MVSAGSSVVTELELSVFSVGSSVVTEPELSFVVAWLFGDVVSSLAVASVVTVAASLVELWRVVFTSAIVVSFTSFVASVFSVSLVLLVVVSDWDVVEVFSGSVDVLIVESASTVVIGCVVVLPVLFGSSVSGGGPVSEYHEHSIGPLLSQ